MVYQMLKGKVASCFLFLFQVVPGETALAFYTARNPTDKPVTGISSYNVVPFDAGQYFNKIQCFCFEEQILNPNEQVRISDTQSHLSSLLGTEFCILPLLCIL